MRERFGRYAVRGLMVGAMLVGIARGAGAQGAGGTAPIERRNILSLNPLGIPFEYFSLEYERMLSHLASVGLTGSYLGIGDGKYNTLEAKLRFYPNEEGPKGFSLGLAGGITRVSEDNGIDINTSESRPTIAVIVDYNWILGKAKRVVVGTGLGAKRVLGVKSEDFSDIMVAYPTARFQIGIRY